MDVNREWKLGREDARKRADTLSEFGNAVCPDCGRVYEGDITDPPPCPVCTDDEKRQQDAVESDSDACAVESDPESDAHGATAIDRFTDGRAMKAYDIWIKAMASDGNYE